MQDYFQKHPQKLVFIWNILAKKMKSFILKHSLRMSLKSAYHFL